MPDSAHPSGSPASPISQLELGNLDTKVGELISTCSRLQEENLALKNQQTSLVAERAQLIERSELARSRVEAMIARLKAMESNS